MTAFPKLAHEPFDLVLDVGGNVGEFAALAHERWPSARVVSFEPIPELAAMNAAAGEPEGKWESVNVAISDTMGSAIIYVCENQHTASTMQEPGGTRGREWGLRDSFVPLRVPTIPLDGFVFMCDGRFSILVKIDVEGHEGHVLRGAADVLTLASTVIVECQQDGDIFVDAPAPHEVDAELRRRGLTFAGIVDTVETPAGRVVQFDGIWIR